MHATESGLQVAWTELRALGVLPPWLSRVQVGATPHDEIFSKGNLRLLKYRGEVTQKNPVVIIPSLINRHYILDLLPERSLVEAFVKAGFETYMMSWVSPPREDRFLTPEDLFEQRIFKAIDVAARSQVGRYPARKVHLVGQCLGGTLATIAALARPEKFASLSLMTAPLNFEDAGQLGTWANEPHFDIDALLDAYGNVPAALLQTSFQFLKPSMPITKYMKLFQRRNDKEFVTNFIAMEMWSNDAIAFPGLCYKFLIENLYRKNVICLGAKEFDTRTLALPVLDAMALDDHIVPIATRLRHDRATRVDLKGGHIGAVIGANARKNFWPMWMEWLKNA